MNRVPISRWFSYGCGIIAVALCFLYGRVHFVSLSESWPLTVRESAHILQTQSLLEGNSPAMYSWGSLPEHANLYGPFYPYLVAPLVTVMPDTPYLAHRLFCAAALLAACICLLVTLRHYVNFGHALLGASLFYAANVASPSIAAGPDLLATLFYTVVLCILQIKGFTARTMALGVGISLLALITKPYAVFALPCLLIYAYLFVSPRRALATFAAALAVLVVAALAVQQFLPAYFHSVFELHSLYTVYHLPTLVQQIRDFSLLYAGLILICLWKPVQSYGVERLNFTALFGAKPLLGNAPCFSRFMVFMASVVLLAKLGWHGGAYLIYFNHLLLPPLILSAVIRLGKVSSKNIYWGGVPLVLNGILILFLCPGLPQATQISEELHSQLLGQRVLVDPLLEPLARSLPNCELVDNGQVEYIINLSNYFPDREHTSEESSEKWLAEQTQKLDEKAYEYILLTQHYSRPYLLWKGKPTRALFFNYDLVGTFDLNIYFAKFRERGQFGQGVCKVLVHKKKAKEDE